MNARLVTRLAWLLWVVAVSLLAASLAFGVADRGVERGDDGDSLAVGVLFAFEIWAFASVGALLAARRPRNSLGWMLAVYGITGAAGAAADGYARHTLFASPGSLPGGAVVAWVANFVIDAPAFAFGFFVLLFLLIPHGRLPSRLWGRMLALVLPALAALQALITLSPGELNAFPGIENPFGVAAAENLRFLETPLFLVLLTFVIASAVSLVRRFLRARGEDRQQLKVVVAACAFMAATIASAPVWWFGPVPERISGVVWPALFASSLASIPLAVAVAILRYRLYDIDRIFNRTLVYGLLTVGLGATYFGLVVGLQALFRPVTGGSDLAIVATTLVVAALFLPARRRLQNAVDRRFNRRAYDAARTIEAFSARLREQIDLDTLRYELLGVVDETMQPARASLWLRPTEGRR